MKKPLIILTLLLITLTSNAQRGEYEQFTAAIFIDPGATVNDGFNFGAEIEYQGRYFYIRPSIFMFPDLNNLPYTDVIGSIGPQISLNKLSNYNWQIYSGIRLGKIFRAGEQNATWGYEAGIDHYFKSNFFIGARVRNDRRTDAIVWHEDPYWRISGDVRFGIRF